MHSWIVDSGWIDGWVDGSGWRNGEMDSFMSEFRIQRHKINGWSDEWMQDE